MNTLSTERLILRKFTPDDWRDLFEYLSNKEVVKYEPYDVYTEEECRQEAINRSQNEAFRAVCLKENGKLIGNLYFEQLEPRKINTWEIGYVFNTVYQGKGYATESCKELLRYAFIQLNAHRIIAVCNPENTASWRLMERLNMRREGHFLKRMYFKVDSVEKPIWHDAFEYAILAEEWFGSSRNFMSGLNIPLAEERSDSRE